MAWYVTQSLPIILATFALGLIVGWLWWGRVWRRVPFGESDAVRAVSHRYQSVVADRDAEIERLGLNVASAAPPVTAASAADGTPGAAGTATAPGPDDAAHRPATQALQAADGADLMAGPDGVPEAAEATELTEPPELPEPPEPDDLQRIEGVGPRIAAALDGAGLRTYRAIAGADDEQLSAALREAGLSFAPSLVTWHLQARMLAAGDEEGLAAIQAEMTAGRSRPADPAPTTEPTTEPTSEPTSEPERSTANGFPPDGSTQDGSTQDGSAPSVDVGTAAVAGTEPRQGAVEPGVDGAGSPTSPTSPTTEATEASAATEPTTVTATAPAGAKEADDEEDELERVEGIGPRIARALRKADIHTYRQLAATDATTLQAALAASGLRFTPSLPTWSRQAALLAEGDEVGFLALTRTLVPDRESGRPS